MEKPFLEAYGHFLFLKKREIILHAMKRHLVLHSTVMANQTRGHIPTGDTNLFHQRKLPNT